MGEIINLSNYKKSKANEEKRKRDERVRKSNMAFKKALDKELGEEVPKTSIAILTIIEIDNDDLD